MYCRGGVRHGSRPSGHECPETWNVCCLWLFPQEGFDRLGRASHRSASHLRRQEAGGAGLPQQLSPHSTLTWTILLASPLPRPPGLQFSATPHTEHIDDYHSQGWACRPAWTGNRSQRPPVAGTPEPWRSDDHRWRSQATNRHSILCLAERPSDIASNHYVGGASSLPSRSRFRHILNLPATGQGWPSSPGTAFGPFRPGSCSPMPPPMGRGFPPTPRHPGLRMYYVVAMR